MTQKNSDNIDQIERNNLLHKLENVLRGDAFLLKESRTTPDDERQARMKAIEAFTKYLRDYDKNIQILAEYKDFKERMVDDGR